MKGLKAKMTGGLQVGSRLKVADNSGAKIVQIIGVRTYKGRNKRCPRGGVGDVVFCTVKEGKADMKHQKFYCVIIRQRRAYRRKSGLRIKFEDNAAVVLKDLEKHEPKGTTIKGPVAREITERYPLLTKLASIVI